MTTCRKLGLAAVIASMALVTGCSSSEYDNSAPPVDYRPDVGSEEHESTASEGAPAPAPDAASDVDRRLAGAAGDDQTMLMAQAGPAPGLPGGGVPDGAPDGALTDKDVGRARAAAQPGANPPAPQGETARTSAPGQAGEPGEAGDPVGPLLIYTADLRLAVFEVRPTQREIVKLALDLGGFLAFQDDDNVTVRIPSRRFNEGLAKVEAAGDLLHSNVQAQDVSEQYRDLAIRLKNSEAVRDRLERLLSEAQNVEEALRVHAELARVTGEIEQLKGTLRFLSDRVAFSTIAVHFSAKATPSVPNRPEVYRLPFPWLDRLGLPSLMTFNQ